MSKEKTISLKITLSPDIIKKLDEGDYNKTKLITRLLKKYLKENKK